MTGEAAPLPPASLPRRFAALAYESLLLAALFLVAGFLTLPLLPPGSGGDLRVPDLPARVASLAVVLAAGAAYCGWFWSEGRRTLPMKTWRLAIVRADGKNAGLRTALVRYAATWIGPVLALAAYVALRRYGHGAHAAWLLAVNFLWAFIDRDRQFLHDRIAGTRIVAAAAPG